MPGICLRFSRTFYALRNLEKAARQQNIFLIMEAAFRPKKKLGQHFLHDQTVAQKIGNLFIPMASDAAVVEIGAGTGALTKWLAPKVHQPFYIVEIDEKLIPMLQKTYTASNVQIVQDNFLTWPLHEAVPGQVSMIGNLPYNISSQIFFKTLKLRKQVRQLVCMVQEEVARRITACPGNKTYGILSVLLQAFYKASYHFSVPPSAFTPPPKIYSGVIKLVRYRKELGCDEKNFFQIVKTAFRQRRKMLRNALKPLLYQANLPKYLLDQRAENLSVEDFIWLTQTLFPEANKLCETTK